MNISEQTVVILCRPEECRNIGSVCRAMKNMGVSKLRIVGKKTDYDQEKIKILAVHAFDVWENALFFDDLRQAVSDCSYVAGTTRRRGKYRKDWLLLPEEFVIQAEKYSAGKIAVVFGNERTGLEDYELAVCNSGVIIPSEKEQGSLNLSHAVQIICYTIYRSQKELSPGYIPVNQSRLSKTVCSITDNLENMGFFKVAGKEDMKNFWQNLLSRAAISEGEAQYIEKLFSKANGLFKKNNELK